MQRITCASWLFWQIMETPSTNPPRIVQVGPSAIRTLPNAVLRRSDPDSYVPNVQDEVVMAAFASNSLVDGFTRRGDIDTLLRGAFREIIAKVLLGSTYRCPRRWFRQKVFITFDLRAS